MKMKRKKKKASTRAEQLDDGNLMFTSVVGFCCCDFLLGDDDPQLWERSSSEIRPRGIVTLAYSACSIASPAHTEHVK